MIDLVYKELKLSINKFFYILPFMLALLMFIPQWIFTFAFSYFFWITASQIYSGYIAQQDNSFCSMLPVTRKNIVKSKIVALYVIEGLHIASGMIMGVIHNLLYGSYNFFLDINVAFVGIVFVLYSLFNIVFLPLYFKTGYYFGRPVIYGVIVTLIYTFILEYGAIRYQFMRDIFEGRMEIQLIVLVVGIVVTVILNYIAVRKSIVNYERIE